MKKPHHCHARALHVQKVTRKAFFSPPSRAPNPNNSFSLPVESIVSNGRRLAAGLQASRMTQREKNKLRRGFITPAAFHCASLREMDERLVGRLFESASCLECGWMRRLEKK